MDQSLQLLGRMRGATRLCIALIPVAALYGASTGYIWTVGWDVPVHGPGVIAMIFSCAITGVLGMLGAGALIMHMITWVEAGLREDKQQAAIKPIREKTQGQLSTSVDRGEGALSQSVGGEVSEVEPCHCNEDSVRCARHPNDAGWNRCKCGCPKWQHDSLAGPAACDACDCEQYVE